MNEEERENRMSEREYRPVEILLVEDNPGDVRLTVEAFKEGKIRNRLSVVRDGVDAIAFLHQEAPFTSAPRPDLILLDLNLPRKNGRDVLAEIKEEEDLKQIPVVVLTTSNAEKDIQGTRNLNASRYINKPVDFEQFVTIVKIIEDFWFSIVKSSNKGDADV